MFLSQGRSQGVILAIFLSIFVVAACRSSGHWIALASGVALFLCATE
jgi:hypothetical protein